MQSDLWSAFDPLASIQNGRDTSAVKASAGGLTALIGKLIGRIALTAAEIAQLPDNYENARRSMPLPDLFHHGTEWLEVIYAPFHVHDSEAGYRRVARVLMHPVAPPADVPAFLLAATKEYPPRSFSAVAL